MAADNTTATGMPGGAAVQSHCVTPSTLDPRTGWAMGNAGIVRELLRFARASTGRDLAYAVDWPDHPGAGKPGTATPGP